MSQFYLTVLQLALCLSPMALGIFISMKVFNIPDITTDGSYTLGASVAALLLTQYQLPVTVIMLLSMLSGALAGTITGFIHTKLKVDALLSGILVMTGLYSVNLLILGRSNVPLIGIRNFFSLLNLVQDDTLNTLFILLVVMALLTGLLYFLLRSDFGIAMRATGNNPEMTSAMGINNDTIRITGLALSNSLTALSGFLMTQNQGFADINMGIGIVITGLGSVLIADTMMKWFNIQHTAIQLILVLTGCLIFESVLGFSLSLGADPNLLKLITSVFVLLIVGIPRFTRIFSKNNS